MSESPLKEMASHRKLKAGHFICEFDTPGVGYILKHAGCDFTILDTEHSGFGIETVRRVMAFMRAAELPAIVRSPSRDYKDIARTLDAGADAVMLPMVSDDPAGPAGGRREPDPERAAGGGGTVRRRLRQRGPGRTPHALCWTDQLFAGSGAADVRAVMAVMGGRAPTGIVNRDVVDRPGWQARLDGYARRFGGA